jgi:hypothetical protein
LVDAAQRLAIARTRNAIIALSRSGCMIHPVTIGDVFEQSIELGLSVSDVLLPRHLAQVTQRARSRAEAE